VKLVVLISGRFLDIAEIILELFVLLGQLSAELLQLLLHSGGFREFRPLGVLLLLQLIASFLGLDMFSFGSLHLRQKFGILALNCVDLIDRRIHSGQLTLQVSIRLLDLTF